MRFVPFVMIALLGCKSSSPPQPPPTVAKPTAKDPAAPKAVDCESVCTDYAVCYEEHYKKDYRGGGECVRSCEDKPAAERSAWADEVGNGCATLFDK